MSLVLRGLKRSKIRLDFMTVGEQGDPGKPPTPHPHPHRDVALGALKEFLPIEGHEHGPLVSSGHCAIKDAAEETHRWLMIATKL